MVNSRDFGQVVLIIVDGFGIAPPDNGNAISNANTPTWDMLKQNFPNIGINASGKHVGLPDGVMGNSEVGHLTIGAGRVIYQSLERINRSIREDKLKDKGEINKILEHLSKSGGDLHLMGLVSDGKVHSDQQHLYYLMDYFNQQNIDKIWIHAFTDGRDTPPDSAVDYIEQLNNKLKKNSSCKLSTLIGRYYAMDRDKKWDRTKIAYDMLIKMEGGPEVKDAIAEIKRRYKNNETDEFLKPIIINPNGRIKDGDAILFFNFRPDRARQITMAINNDEDVDFETEQFEDLLFVTMTRYEEEWNYPVLFEMKIVKNSLAKVISDAGLKQVHIAETEKYAHVTYFINGGIEKPHRNEDRILVPSPKMATYDLIPQMSTPEITKETISKINEKRHELIVINIACPDMVGHTGDFQATIKAVEAMDQAFSEIYAACKDNNCIMVITSDHGNAEKMLHEGSIHTAHTTNKVPLLITSNSIKIKKTGGLKNIAPTVLKLLGIEKPDEMEGTHLIDD